MKNLELIEEYQKLKSEVNKLFCFGNYVQNIEITEYKGVKYVSISILNFLEVDDKDFKTEILIDLDEKIEDPFIIKGKEQELLDLLKS